MAGTTVRIGSTAHEKLRELARESGQSMQAVLEKAIEETWRRRFLEECNLAFARLRKNEKLWKHELAERKAWDATLADGLVGD